VSLVVRAAAAAGPGRGVTPLEAQRHAPRGHTIGAQPTVLRR